MEDRPVAPHRPRYRAGNKETAVKAYTINQESRYLMVKNVPALGNVEDLIKLFALYGTIEEYRLLDEEEAAAFTDIYWIRFTDIAASRTAKKKLDDYNFIGSLLEVTYAPQYETVHDMRSKLEERRRIVAKKIAQHYGPEKRNRPTEKPNNSNINPEKLEPNQLPFEAPPEFQPTQLELLATPKYRNENPHLYVQGNIRGDPLAIPPGLGMQPPPRVGLQMGSAAVHPQPHPLPRGPPEGVEREIRQPSGRTAGGGLVDTYIADSSVNATVLSIRSKLNKLSDTHTIAPVQGPHPLTKGLYPSQIPEQGTYYPTPAKRKRI